ncbi:MFS transporter [Roseateles sp.]|uniref:MFS transporter n=1 Tax=Roseateles sp. TaxID=1971397 RepID=UPI003BA75932
MPLQSALETSSVSSQNRVAGTLVYTAGGLLILFLWLLFGDFAIAMRERAAVPSVMELLRQHHASATTMSILVVAFPAIIGLLLVPVVSFKSDRYRSDRGRRIPFLIIPTPIGAAAMVGLGFTPWLGTQLHHLLGQLSPGLDFCVLSFFCVFWTVFECVAVLTLAMFTALINDVVPKGLLGRFFGLFRSISLGAGIIFNYWIFKLTETHLMEIFVSIGLFFGLAFTLMCLMVKEGEYPAPEDTADDAAAQGFVAGAKTYFVECFSQRYYRWAFAAIAIGTLAPSPFNTFYQWYAGNLGMPKETLGKLSAYSYGVSIGLAYFIGWLVDRFNALRVATGALLVYMTVMLCGYLMIHDVNSFGVFYVLHVVISGAYFTSAASLPMMLFPQMRFSQFASAAGMVTGLSTLAVSLVQGPVLDLNGNDYKLTLLGSSIFAALAVLLNFVVLRHQAPEPLSANANKLTGNPSLNNAAAEAA